MARIRNKIENVIVIPASSLPASSAGHWWSGKGDSNDTAVSTTGDPGAPASPGPAGQGINIEGEWTNGINVDVVVTAWGTCTGLEIAVEYNRDPLGTLEWLPLTRTQVDTDTLRMDVKPMLYKIMKADLVDPDAAEGGFMLPLYDVVGKRIRIGVRSIDTTPGVAALHVALELVQRYV